MQRIDLPAFESFLQELAECYSQRPYSAAAIKHWFEALSEFSWEKVRHRLVLWRDSKNKQPAISDIVSVLRDAASDDLERRAVEDKKSFSKPLMPATEYGSACMAEIMRTIRVRRHPGRWWAYELRDMQRCGRILYYAQERAAMHACGDDWNNVEPYRGEGKTEPKLLPERIPGEDDE